MKSMITAMEEANKKERFTAEKLQAAAKDYAEQFKTRYSSEGLENVASDFQAGALWAFEQVYNRLPG